MSEIVAAPAKKSFLRRPAGRAALVVGALAVIGAGAATAQGWSHRHGPGMGPGPMGHGFERFCAVDPAYVTQKMADGVTARLGLVDNQKAALSDLRETAVKVALDAKKLCADKPDMTTTPGRLAAAQARLGAANTAMTTLKPKIEAFYATLNDAQKQQFDAMGPMGGGKKHGWGMRGEGRVGGMQGMGGWRQHGMMGMQGMGGMGGMSGMGGMQGMQGMSGMQGMAPKQ